MGGRVGEGGAVAFGGDDFGDDGFGVALGVDGHPGERGGVGD